MLSVIVSFAAALAPACAVPAAPADAVVIFSDQDDSGSCRRRVCSA